MGAEPERWSLLVRSCWGASPSLGGLGKAQVSALSLPWVPLRGGGGLAVSQSTKTLLKNHQCLPAPQQTTVWDAGCPAGGVSQLSLGREGITVVPCETCLGVGSRQQILAEVKEVPEMPPSNILPFAFGWRGAWRGSFSLSVLAEVSMS